MKILNLILLLSLSFTVSCAYHAGFGERAIPGGYTHIAVPVFKNHTIETGVEVYFTNAMIRELERSKLAKVTNRNDAQVTLEGIVTSVVFVPGAQTVSKFNPTMNPNNINDIDTSNPTNPIPYGTALFHEYRILVTIELSLRRNSDQKVLWSGLFNGERKYDAPIVGSPILNSVNAVYNHSAHYQNIALMAGDMMSEAHDRMTENF